MVQPGCTSTLTIHHHLSLISQPIDYFKPLSITIIDDQLTMWIRPQYRQFQTTISHHLIRYWTINQPILNNELTIGYLSLNNNEPPQTMTVAINKLNTTVSSWAVHPPAYSQLSLTLANHCYWACLTMINSHYSLLTTIMSRYQPLLTSKTTSYWPLRLTSLSTSCQPTNHELTETGEVHHGSPSQASPACSPVHRCCFT